MNTLQNIDELIKCLPNGYLEAFETLKIVARKRNIKNPLNIMKLALYHLLHGCSLIEVSAIAKLNGIASISDVGFMNLFAKCGKWFKWINSNIKLKEQISYNIPDLLRGLRVIAVDGSDVLTGGKAKQTFRLHYGIDIFKMTSVFYNITEEKVGESLKNFDMKANDLILGDRAYATVTSIQCCISHNANYLLRLRNKSLTLYDDNSNKIDLLDRLNMLSDNEELDLYAEARTKDGRKVPVRICAKRKTPEAIASTKKRLQRKESKKQVELSPETKEFNNFIVLVTSLSEEISASQILELYRYRWQVEIYFKRLKSLFSFGEIPKKRKESTEAWLNGKLMIALLVESIISNVDFSPYGDDSSTSEYLA
jgi:hypothetical protein